MRSLLFAVPLCLGVLCPTLARAGADGDLYTVAGGDCDDLNPTAHPGETEVCNGIDDDCDGQVDEGGASPMQCNSFPTLAAPANTGSTGAFLLHLEKFVPSVDLTGIPIYSNTGVGLSAPGGLTANVQSILVRNWQGSSVNGGIDVDFAMTFPPGVTLLGWVTTFQGGPSYNRDLDANFSVTGGSLAISGIAANMELSGNDSDTASVAFEQAFFDSIAGAGGADEARLLISYDPAAVGALSFTVSMLGTIQNVIHCDTALAGQGTFTVPLTTRNAAMVDADTDGYTTCDGDCNDGLVFVNPGQPEICNAADDDCDGTNNEGFDVDGDGVVSCQGDCDDGNPAVNPQATEDCINLVDDDCDTFIDTLDPECPVGDDDDATADDDDSGDDDDSAGDDDDATADDDDSGDDDDATTDDDDATADDDDATADDDDATADDDDATADDDDATADDDDATADDDDATVIAGDDDDAPDCGCSASVQGGATSSLWLVALLATLLPLRRDRR